MCAAGVVVDDDDDDVSAAADRERDLEVSGTTTCLRGYTHTPCSRLTGDRYNTWLGRGKSPLDGLLRHKKVHHETEDRRPTRHTSYSETMIGTT